MPEDLVLFDAGALPRLIDELRERDYVVLGPTVRGSAMTACIERHCHAGGGDPVALPGGG